MALNPTLLFILKAPIVGSVKTRLAEEIGEVRALIAYQKMAEYLFDQLAPHLRMPWILCVPGWVKTTSSSRRGKEISVLEWRRLSAPPLSEVPRP